MSKANESIYVELRHRIVAGRYDPGQQLKEEALASELGVSRTPVRAALRRLVADGMLEAKANRGAFVAQWTDRDIDEVMNLRCALESEAASLAAKRAGKDQIKELASINQRMHMLARGLTSAKIAELQRLNNRFHKLILESAGSPRLNAATRTLIDWPLMVGSFYVFSEADIRRSIQYHDDLVLAIETNEPALARAVMEAHLRRSNLTYRLYRKT